MGDNWRTPPWLLEVIFPDGRFFDPNPANPDGLRDFEGMGAWPADVPVFLNPPYSDPGPWLRRAWKHAGPIVCLVKSDHSTEWWQRYSGAFHVVRIGQRLRFIGDDPDGGVANFPSELWYKGWPWQARAPATA